MLEKILSGYLNKDNILKALMGISLAKEEKSRYIIVIGPNEIYTGITNIFMHIKHPEDKLIDDSSYLREKIVDILNEIQHFYIYSSKKYWWHNVSSDHFCDLIINTGEFLRVHKKVNSYNKVLPPFLSENEFIDDFKKILANKNKIFLYDRYLINAKRHYLTNEYNLMYIELSIAFENLMNRSFKKIIGYEKGMFIEGKLQGKIIYILHHYCKWNKEEIDLIKDICDIRNDIIHNNRENFGSIKNIFQHLTSAEKAIKDIEGWLNQD